MSTPGYQWALEFPQDVWDGGLKKIYDKEAWVQTVVDELPSFTVTLESSTEVLGTSYFNEKFSLINTNLDKLINVKIKLGEYIVFCQRWVFQLDSMYRTRETILLREHPDILVVKALNERRVIIAGMLNPIIELKSKISSYLELLKFADASVNNVMRELKMTRTDLRSQIKIFEHEFENSGTERLGKSTDFSTPETTVKPVTLDEALYGRE